MNYLSTIGFQSFFIIIMTYDIKIKDISKKMGCSIGTTKSRLFSAKNILREKILQKI